MTADLAVTITDDDREIVLVLSTTIRLTVQTSNPPYDEHHILYWKRDEADRKKFTYGGIIHEVDFVRFHPSPNDASSSYFLLSFQTDNPPSKAHTAEWRLYVDDIELSFEEAKYRLGDDDYIWYGAAFRPLTHSQATREVNLRIEQQVASPTNYVVVKPNRRPTGELTINGDPRVGETLTVDTSNIIDPEGMLTSIFRYYWMFVYGDGNSRARGNDGGPEFTLDSRDESDGHSIFARVTFTDDAGQRESVRSEIMTIDWGNEESHRAREENSPATGAPAISGTARVGETLTADTSAVSDDDGLSNAAFNYQWIRNDGLSGAAFSYQWIRNDGSSDTDTPGATDSTYALVAADEGKTIKVRVSFTDDAANAESLTSTATETVSFAVQQQIAYNPATGAPSISGTAQVGEMLTV